MSAQLKSQKVGASMVVGGGVGGIQAALDLADSGIKVYLVEDRSSIGGVMSQLDKTFPTNDCAMCTLAPRLVGVGRHKDIEIISLSEIVKVEGEPGNFKVTLKMQPRYVDEEKCTGCGTCVSNCPTRNRVQPMEPSPVEIEPEFREKVREIVNKHKGRDGPLMPILQEINANFNYLPESALRYVSKETGYPLTHILRIATFYSAFSITSRGKYIINVCMGTTCYVRGAEKLMERFSDDLKIKEGDTTQDRLFTLKSVRCIGCCGLAPALMVNEEVYGKVTIPQVKEIIKKYKEAA